MPDSSNDFDLDAYARRIGLAIPRSLTLETLSAIHGAHTGAIAFENLDPWLGRTPALDAASLQHKLVSQGRGGFCYEHNLLLGAALRRVGFNVTDLAARVRWNIPPEVLRPRTHMLLLVNVGTHRYLVDAGFGGHTVTAPLRLDRRVPQATPHGSFRLQREDGQYTLQALVREDWRTLYVFDLQPQTLGDFEMACWYLCNHPASVFRSTLMAARPLPDGGRLALRDQQFSEYRGDGEPQVQAMDSGAVLRELLQRRFGLQLGGLDGLDERLAALAAGGPPAATS